jgi:FtsH-binding integral membrane protein
VKDLVQWLRNQSDRVASWACIGLGVICLIAGWVGVSATAFPGEQMPYVVSGGLVGLFLLGLGGVMWLSADLRDEWRELGRLERAVLVAGGVEPDGTQ